ncbi:hypothetical protein H8R18_00630 [Nanchangia anserum]|uniref:Uncharacterized protein n=1 Tax=Nanchangia anserum TaxID=2692125 RepID=A0A8I0KNX5_9ACTO|nr:hypothetical protein [Nanchangia anserum]MBD3689751.1 hypothetical protein [Nanchangia anserum]QOX81920.1 hypothetical protein H8R18_00630 [Nanchangia anserum]
MSNLHDQPHTLSQPVENTPEDTTWTRIGLAGLLGWGLDVIAPAGLGLLHMWLAWGLASNIATFLTGLFTGTGLAGLDVAKVMALACGWIFGWVSFGLIAYANRGSVWGGLMMRLWLVTNATALALGSTLTMLVNAS